jgi:pimeloyl-ACP methyl ester carboxylesterase
MSTPPFIAMPDGVAALGPPDAPLPALVAEPAMHVTDAPQVADVVLVPGFTGSKEDYIAVLGPLAGRGWRVVALDLPGQGGAPPLGGRGAHSAQALAAAVADLACWFAPDRRVHLVGHSMGGLVTRALVIDHPQLVASWTIVCSGRGPVPPAAQPNLHALQHLLDTQPMPEIWRIKERLDRAGGWCPPSEEVAQFCARRFIANDPAALFDAAELLLTAADRTDQAAGVLAAHGIPAAVVTGALDDAWPLAEQEEMAERLGAPWHVLPGIAHNPSTEDPQGMADVLDAVFRGTDRG